MFSSFLKWQKHSQKTTEQKLNCGEPWPEIKKKLITTQNQLSIKVKMVLCARLTYVKWNGYDSLVLLKLLRFLPRHFLAVKTSNLPYRGWSWRGGDPQNGCVIIKKIKNDPLFSRWNKVCRYWVFYLCSKPR